MKNAEEESALISTQCKILTKLLSMETRRHFGRHCIRLPHWLPLQSCKLGASANSNDTDRFLRAGFWFSCKESYKTHTRIQGREQSSTGASCIPCLLFQL